MQAVNQLSRYLDYPFRNTCWAPFATDTPYTSLFHWIYTPTLTRHTDSIVNMAGILHHWSISTDLGLKILRICFLSSTPYRSTGPRTPQTAEYRRTQTLRTSWIQQATWSWWSHIALAGTLIQLRYISPMHSSTQRKDLLHPPIRPPPFSTGCSGSTLLCHVRTLLPLLVDNQPVGTRLASI